MSLHQQSVWSKVNTQIYIYIYIHQVVKLKLENLLFLIQKLAKDGPSDDVNKIRNYPLNFLKIQTQSLAWSYGTCILRSKLL